ncbi:MAG: PilZ domain-containing protein [Spirochaetales bacterium]|nr:PilZ domain-containing protein [Spirochaetales bacterium]
MSYFERRKSIRVDLDVIINYDMGSSAKTKNICEQGMCIIIDKNYMQGKYLKIILKLSGLSKILIIGNVAWSRHVESGNYEIGIEFWHIEEQDRKTIRDYITSQISKGVEHAYTDSEWKSAIYESNAVKSIV